MCKKHMEEFFAYNWKITDFFADIQTNYSKYIGNTIRIYKNNLQLI